MTESPTGFTYREREWWKISPDHAPRKVVMAALREAKHDGTISHSHMGGTREEVRAALRSAIQRREKKMRGTFQGVRASEINDELRAMGPPRPL